MNSGVVNVHVIVCGTTAVCLITWIILSVWKMCSKLKTVVKFCERVDDTFSNCLESIAGEIYEAAKNSANPKFAEKCINLLCLYPEHVNTPVTRKQFTPFLRACWTGSTPVVKHMLENGADILRRTSVGESAFFLATHGIARNKTWNPALLSILYQSGCSVNARRVHGYSPLHLAAAYGHKNLVGWLLAHGADPSATTTCGVRPIDLAFYNGWRASEMATTLKILESNEKIIRNGCLYIK